MSTRRTLIVLLLLTVIAEVVALTAVYSSWQGNPQEMARRVGAMQVRILRQASERLINEVEGKILSLGDNAAITQASRVEDIDWNAVGNELSGLHMESLEVHRHAPDGHRIFQYPPTAPKYSELTDAEKKDLAAWAANSVNAGRVLIDMPELENFALGTLIRYTLPVWRTLSDGSRLPHGFLCVWVRTASLFSEFLIPAHLLPAESYSFVLLREHGRPASEATPTLLWHSSEGQWLDTTRSQAGRHFVTEFLAAAQTLVERGDDYDIVKVPRRVGPPREEVLSMVPVIFGTRRWLLFQSTPYSVAVEYSGHPEFAVVYLGAALLLLPAIVVLASALSGLAASRIYEPPLEEDFAHYRELFAENPTGMLVLEDEGKVVDCNHSAERLLGVSRQEAIGQKLQEFFEGPEAGRLLTRILNEKYLHARDASLTRRRDRVALLVEVWGRIIGRRCIFMLQDVQRRRSLEQQVSRLKRMESVGGLVSTLAHDFNNALGQVQILVSHARHQAPPDAEFQAELSAAEDKIDHAATLISDLQALRDETISSQPVELSDLLRRFASQQRRLLPTNVTLSLELEEPLPSVTLAEPAMWRILDNLSGNAVDAMPYGGRINIKAYPKVITSETLGVQIDPGSYAVIEFGDTGTGVPEHVLDNIFEPFFSTKRAGKGTGLGLWTVYKLLRRARGWIDVHSQVGKGTVFTLYLLAAEMERDGDREIAVAASQPVAGNPT